MNTHKEEVKNEQELQEGMTECTETFVTPGGVDTVHCSFYCRFTPTFKKHLYNIACAKQIAENPPDDTAEDAPMPIFECANRLYVVMPYGFNPNKGISRYCYYQYVLKDGGITIGIQPRDYRGNLMGEEDDKDKNKCPNIRVEIGALPLILAGSMKTIMEEVEERLSEMGLVIVKNRLGRVDVCVDLPFHVRQLQYAVIDRRFISKTRTYDLHAIFNDDVWDAEQILPDEFDEDVRKASMHFKGYACTGFSIGRDKILCRGYDKLEKEKHNEEMLLALAERRCGGELWKDMTRIEFQIRRDALRGMTVAGHRDGIETWQDFVQYQSAIVRYLCTDWLVFTGKTFCRSHSERIKRSVNEWHPDWVKAVEAFKSAFGTSDQTIRRITKSIKREAKASIAAAIGNDQSAILKTNLELSPDDPEWKEKLALFRYASTFRHLDDPKKEKAFWRNWDNKELRQECSIPAEALSDLIPMASKGAGVTHGSPLPEMMRVLLTPAGASGPAPSVIS